MRLFVAVILDDAVRESLEGVQRQLRGKTDGVRWVEAKQLHMTVKFLGDVEDRRVPQVIECIKRAADANRPFALVQSRCGCFPPTGAVRVIWSGDDGVPQPLSECVESVESELADLGFAREGRVFSPHITLGRVREDRSRGAIRAIVESKKFDRVEQSVTELTLMSSILSPRGPTYTEVSRFSLAG